MRTTVVVNGLHEPEGPVVLPDGDVALVQMAAAHASVSRTTPAGERRDICRPGGRPNGLALDGDGCLWVAGAPDQAVGRYTADGELRLAVRDGFDWPNDVAFGPDGLLYLTDSGITLAEMLDGSELRRDWLDLEYRGAVVQIDPREGRVLRRLATGLKFANGIAFSPAGELYFSESLTGVIYRQPLDGPAVPYAQVLDRPPTTRFRGPDGMAFAADGTLFSAVFGAGYVAVVAPGGGSVERIPLDGAAPTNVAFAEDGSGDIFVTEVQKGVLLRIAVGKPGLALRKPRLDGA